ncbi:MAG: hypothetical protein ACJ745_14585 [Actinomycetes bacterium]
MPGGKDGSRRRLYLRPTAWPPLVHGLRNGLLGARRALARRVAAAEARRRGCW